jgi:uncharacterized protein
VPSSPPTPSPLGFALLVLAGVAAGLAGSIGGLASLFSYPALLAAGLPATAANVTNTVALAVSSASSITSSRPELTGQASVVRRLGLLCLVGGAAGAGLVLVTPPGVFARLVPLLIAGSSVALLVRRSPTGPVPGDAAPRPVRPGPAALLGVLAVAVYGGYFGAAAGVLLLALLVTLGESLVRASALKNVLLGAANLVAAVGFAVFGPVAWLTALPLTAGLFVGNWVGPALARRLPVRVMRVGIAVAGLGLAAKLAWDAYRG